MPVGSEEIIPPPMAANEPAETDTVGNILAEAYGLSMLSCEPLYSCYDKNFHVKADRGEYFFRIYSATTASHVPGQVRAIETLTDCGIPTASFVPLSDGSGCIGEHERLPFTLQTFVAPDSLRDAGLTVDRTRRAGGLLRTMHAVMATLPSPETYFQEYPWDLRQFDLVIPHLRAKQSTIVPIERGIIEDTVAWWQSAQPELRTLPRQVIHGDFHMSNILLSDETIVPIDFMDVNYSWRINDIAIALFHLIFRDCRPDLVDTFFDGYGRDLCILEQNILPRLILLRAIDLLTFVKQTGPAFHSAKAALAAFSDPDYDLHSLFSH